jgi:phosphoribosylformimino-5-aminoimidazole carboxamide ribotide isomerase
LERSFVIVPAVDVLDGRAVRLHQGDYDHVQVEAGDPLELVRAAAALSPPFVHVVALGAARDGGAPVELAARVVAAASPVPVQLGGGVRSVADVVTLRAAGVARVMIGTAAFGETPLRDFGDVVVAIDVAQGVVRTRGWRESSGLTTAQALARCAEAGVTKILCTAVERDGTASGPDLALLREARALFDGEILAAGGIRHAADIDAIRALGIDGAVVGRAWLEGTISL